MFFFLDCSFLGNPVCGMSPESTAEIVQDASDDHQPPVQPIVKSTPDGGMSMVSVSNACFINEIIKLFKPHFIL